MLGLYNIALFPLRASAALWAAWSARDPVRRVEWGERLGRRLPAAPPGGLWLHGASVGEARLVARLASAVRSRRPGLPMYASATTVAGRAGLPAPPAVDAAFFVPLDFRGLGSRVLGALRPAALVLVETELWPNLLHETLSAGVPIVVLNGRLSARRMRRYRRLGGLYRPLLARVAAVGAQSEADAQRFVELGAPHPRVRVTGNLKYDLVPPPGGRGVAARPTFVAGSTAPGEEAAVIEAFRRARATTTDLLLVLAPRHLNRVAEVDALVRSSGLTLVRLGAGAPIEGLTDVLLVDTLGDLPALYRDARVAFVGGSLVPVGGHNLLEPAAAGVPVLFGPHVDHVAEPAAALERAGGGRRVRDAAELAAALGTWLADDRLRVEAGEAARQVVESNRGAVERSVGLLLETLDRCAAVRDAAGAP